MKTPLELAAEHARAYVRNRGWRVEPLSWEEVEVLLEEMQTLNWNWCECDGAA